MEDNKQKTIKAIKKYVPSTKSFIRAGFAGIPLVGGSLDHLLFDKSEEIRMRNLELLVQKLTESVNDLRESQICISWFESVEAIDMFKNLYSKIEFESNENKVKTLCQLFCRFGLEENKDDPNKLAVLETVSKLTNNQKVIFMAINKVPTEEKTSTTDAVRYTAKAKWLSTILDYVNQKEILSQLDLVPSRIELKIVDEALTAVVKKNNIILDEELDILASFNLLRIDRIPNISDTAYDVTALGRLTYSYLKDAK